MASLTPEMWGQKVLEAWEARHGKTASAAAEADPAGYLDAVRKQCVRQLMEDLGCAPAEISSALRAMDRASPTGDPGLGFDALHAQAAQFSDLATRVLR